MVALPACCVHGELSVLKQEARRICIAIWQLDERRLQPNHDMYRRLRACCACWGQWAAEWGQRAHVKAGGVPQDVRRLVQLEISELQGTEVARKLVSSVCCSGGADQHWK